MASSWTAKLSKKPVNADTTIEINPNKADAVPAEYSKGWRARAFDCGTIQPIAKK